MAIRVTTKLVKIVSLDDFNKDTNSKYLKIGDNCIVNQILPSTKRLPARYAVTTLHGINATIPQSSCISIDHFEGV